MNPELEHAIRERIDLGHSREQITDELRQAGYDDATIGQVFAHIDGAATPVPPPAGGGTLIGYGELISGSFSLLFSEWKLFLVSSAFGLLWLIGLGVLFVMAAVSAESSIGAPIVLGVISFLYAFIGVITISLGFQRALLLRREQQPFVAHLVWVFQNLIGLILVTLYVQFATSLGYVLLVIPGIALAIYLSYAMLVRVLGEETGVMALVRSTELIYGRWWGVLFRVIVSSLVFALCLIPLVILVSISGSFMLFNSFASVAAGGVDTVGALLIPLLLGLLFFAGILFVALLMQCAMVLLFESLRATAVPFAVETRQKVYKWMRVAVIVGIVPAIFLNGMDVMSPDPTEEEFEALFEQMLEGTYDESADMRATTTFEADPEFEAFLEEFEEEFDSF